MILKFDTNIKPIYATSISEFNSYVEKYKALCPYELILTKGKNIAQANMRNMPCCKTWKRGNHMEFHALSSKFRIRVIYALHYDEEANVQVNPYDALCYFKEVLDLIPTDDVEEDTEIFTCPENSSKQYYNYVNERYVNMTINNCYSLDRNNSFPASMAKVYPDTKPYVDKYYQDRLAMKGKPGYEEFKLYGSIFIGWLKNKNRIHAWKKIISDSNETVHKLRKEIEANGNTVLLVNTDAIKFRGKFDYNESTELGQFKYEWKDTQMYIKGVKSYAYKENDKWHFKQAGKCRLDKIKDREEWTLDEFKNPSNTEVFEIRIDKDDRLYETYTRGVE